MHGWPISLVLCLLALCGSLPLLADDTDPPSRWAAPLPAQSRHPIRLALLDPFPASALKSSDDPWRMSLQLEYASIFLWERGRTIPPNAEGLEMVQIDSELAITQLRLEWQSRNAGLRLGGQVGVLHYSAGFMDDELSAYHSAFGLPNLGKEDQPSDRFRGTLQGPNSEIAWQSDSGGVRIGNTQLWGGYAFGPYQLHGWSVGAMPRAQAKLDTGDKGYGLDVGGFDFSIGGALSARRGSVGIDANLDFILPSEVDFRGVAGFSVRDHLKATLAGQWEAWESVWLQLQFSGATPVFRAPRPLKTMTHGPLSVSFGATFALDHGFLQIGMNEDLGYAEVDFAFFVAWSIDF